MKSEVVLLGAGMVLFGLGRAGLVDVRRNTASWTLPFAEGVDFDVWTIELTFGGWYGEVVWGWWPPR